MTLQKINTRNTILILMIVLAAVFRLVAYKYPYLLSNFTPVGAIALFGGAYFTDRWKAYLVPLMALFLSDMLLNYFYTSKLFFWSTDSLWVYLCFAVFVAIGGMIRKATVVNVLLASILSVGLHWLIMDLPWLMGNLYPNTLAGYEQSLTAAIPFEKNMILGDVLFGFILFGGFELAKSKYVNLRSKAELAI
jgi:hypothetical protein